MKKPFVLAISGVKNSGKTTLICKILPVLKAHGLKIAVIKHDGHDFDADVPGTDTYRQFHAGAYGTAVFSDRKFMVVKQQRGTDPEQLAGLFPEADMILLEGFKHSRYPKIEVIRQENIQDRPNGQTDFGARYNLHAIATDLPREELALHCGTGAGEASWYREEIPLLDMDSPGQVADFVWRLYCETIGS